jgi:hypothetical protein
MSDITETWKREQGRIVVCRSQDVTPYLEANKRKRNDFQSRRGSALREVADIPNVIVEQWMKEGVNVFDPNCDKEVQRRLNSNEYAFLRTSPGKVAIVKAKNW